VVVENPAGELPDKLGRLVVGLARLEMAVGHGPVIRADIDSVKREGSREIVMFDPVFRGID